MTKKISLIGAGSAIFSINLIRDICLTPNLQGFTVNLMDINKDRLESAYRLCRRYSQEMGIELKLEKTTSREESLQGADFVINTALIGGWGNIEPGWEIGLKHGYRFGGSLHIMHDEAFWMNYYQFRFFDSMAEDILRICPKATYFLIANPVFAGTTYLGRKYPQLKFVGLCHGYSGIYELVDALGLDKKEVSYEIPGVNHCVWLTKFTHKGEDVYPLLDQWLAEHDSSDPETPWQLKPKRVDLYRRFGRYPIGDTGSEGGGDWPWWHHVDDATEDRFNEHPQEWFKQYIEFGHMVVDKTREVTLDETIKLSDILPAEKSGEVVIPMIESIACDLPRVLIGNTLNSEGCFVPGVPADIAVEIPMRINGEGIQGMETTPLPAGILSYILRDYVAAINLEIAAYEQHSKALLLALIMQDPWTRTREQAESFLDEILALPFNEEMRQYYQ